MSIIGETLNDSVTSQILVRQRLYGKKNRNNVDLNILNNTNAWLKLASSVRVLTEVKTQELEIEESIKAGQEIDITSGEQRLRDIGLNNTGEFTGNQLARKAVLFNTLTEVNPATYNDKNEKTSQGSHISRFGVSSTNSLWNNSSYGLGGTDFGIVPAPGLISAKIDCKNRGSIREATVELKAYNLFQFELIELLYLRLGYSMLLEWGWNQYLDDTEKLKLMGNTLTEDLWFQDFPTYNYLKVIKGIERYRKLYQSNYDGFLGKVVNFDWSFQPDGTYDITLKLITIGDVVESLKVNLPSKLITDAEFKKAVGKGNTFSNNLVSLESPIVTNAGSSTLSLSLYDDIASSKPNKWWGWKTNYSSLFLNLSNSNEFRIKNTEGTNTKNEQFPPTGTDSNKYTYFLTFRALLDKLNTLCIPSINGGKILQFDISDDNICSAFPNQVSFNPKVCLIKPQYTEDINLADSSTGSKDRKTKPFSVKNDFNSFAKLKDFFQAETSTNVLYGDIMNIYLNYDFISNTLQQNTKNGEISIYKFLEDICNNINSSLGDLNKLEPIIENDSTIKIIDQNPIPGIEKSEAFGCRFPDPVPFEIYGFTPSGSSSTSNFVRNFGFKTKIGPELASMITIGTTAQNKSTKNYDGTAFSKWNEGLEDAYAVTYDDPEDIKLGVTNEDNPESFPLTKQNLEDMSAHFKKSDDDKKKFLFFGRRDPFISSSIFGFTNIGTKNVEDCPITHNGYDEVTWAEYVMIAQINLKYKINHENPPLVPKPDQSISLDNYLGWLIQAFGGNINGDWTYKPLYFYLNDEFYKIGKELFKGFINGVNNEIYSLSKTPSNTVGFIPADLSLTINGLSGIKIYNALSVNQRFLPKQYPNALKFIITKVNHDISSNDWSTSLNTISIPKTAPYDPSFFKASVSNVISSAITEVYIGNLPGAEEYNSLPRIPIANLKISAAGLENIKKDESFRDKAYDDNQTRISLTSATIIKGTLTIGYGFTKAVIPDLKWNSTITRQEADKLLVEKIVGYEQRVKNEINVPLRQEEYDALVSIAWNAGSIGDTSKGDPSNTPLKKTINNKQYREAAEVILIYRTTGQGFVGPVRGLENRRKKERNAYLSGVNYVFNKEEEAPLAYQEFPTGPKF
jgi:lysozyme